MTPMAPTRPIRPPDPITAAATGPAAANGAAAGVCLRRVVRLESRLSAVAAARTEVEAAIGAWCVAVDPDVAILLTSELVTNAVTHATARRRRDGEAARRGFAAGAVLLVIVADDAGLRVDVHDGCGDLPVLADCPADADAETGRGLLLVTSLSAEWGFYRTPGGKAVYFTLEAQPDVHRNVIVAPHGHDPRSVS
jgi:anti-sigma regulatory factor (Ser/Thr protein kinase)